MSSLSGYLRLNLLKKLLARLLGDAIEVNLLGRLVVRVFAQAIKETVGRLGNDFLFEFAGGFVEQRATGVVEVVPLASEVVLSKGCVVAVPLTAEVVGHRKAVVYQGPLRFLALTQHEGLHVQPLQGEVDMRVQLVVVVLAQAKPAAFEPLQADD